MPVAIFWATLGFMAKKITVPGAAAMRRMPTKLAAYVTSDRTIWEPKRIVKKQRTT